MKLPIGIHSGSPDVQTMWDQIRKWSERQIDGHNISDQLLGTGLEFSDEDTTIQVENRPARQIQVAIGDVVQAWDQQLDQLSTGSTLTQNILPKANATSGLQDSGLSDNGTTITSTRNYFAFPNNKIESGSGFIKLEDAFGGGPSLVLDEAESLKWGLSIVELALKFSNPGVALLYDPSAGNTAPMLQFNGTTSANSALKRNGTSLETKLADDSAYAKHVANVLESKVATGTAPLIVASTTKVTNLNADQLDGLDSAAFALALSGTSGAVSKFTSSTTIGDSGITIGGNSEVIFPKGFAPTTMYSEPSGTTTLTASSNQHQHFKISSAQNVDLPNTPTTGLQFLINNSPLSGGSITLRDSGGATLATVPAGAWVYAQHRGVNTWDLWGNGWS